MEQEKMNTAKLTEKYIEEHPYIKETLKQGLINYSSLARYIADDLGIKKKSSFDAILVASRRYFEKINTDKKSENKIVKLFKESKIEIKTKISVAIISQRISFTQLLKVVEDLLKKNEAFHLMQGSKTFTLVMPQEFMQVIKKKFPNDMISTRENLVQIIVKTSPEIEKIPGVVSYLYSLFAQNGINMFEEMSSWEDTLIIIEEKDLPKAMEILKF